VSTTSEQIIKEALALPVPERAELLERLLVSFQSPPNAHIDELWAREAEDRIDAYDRGELRAAPAEEVFNRIKQRRAK
jgi:putative addiction module component (TIGR02574 family)